MSTKIFTRILLVAFLTLPLAKTLPAQAAPRESLLVLSKHDRTLAIVDPATLKLIAKAPVGDDPHEVIASSDGKTAYVSNYGSGAFNALAVIDLVAQKALASIDLGALRGPHGLDFSAGKVWFTAEAAKAIASYDPASKKIDWIFGTGQNRTHMIYVMPDAQRIVTTNVSSATVSIIEKFAVTGPGGPPPGAARTDWNQTVISVGYGDEGFDISPDHKEIWTANAQDGTISIIDFAQKKVTQTLSANVRSANRLKFTPDGKLVFVSMLGSSDGVVLNTATRSEVKRIPVGHGAAGIQMQPDGSRVFIACTPDNYVAVVDLPTLAVTAHIDAGRNPDGMAWAVQR